MEKEKLGTTMDSLVIYCLINNEYGLILLLRGPGVP